MKPWITNLRILCMYQLWRESIRYSRIFIIAFIQLDVAPATPKLMIRSLLFCRNYAAAAAKAKRPIKEKTGPTKQVLMKNKKNNAFASNNLGGGQIGVNRLAPLTLALFNVDQECIQASEASRSNHAEMHRREVIELAWNKLALEKMTEQKEWERGFLHSKSKALLELKKVSPKLYNDAIAFDYTIAPINQRPATLTPPSLDKFPFKQEEL